MLSEGSFPNLTDLETHLVDRHDISQTNTKIFANNFIHTNFALLTKFICEYNANCVFAFFALDQNRIPAKELQLIHLLKVERHDAVVIVHSFVWIAISGDRCQVSHCTDVGRAIWEGRFRRELILGYYTDRGRRKNVFLPTTRRFGDFLRSRMAVDVSFLT